MQSSLLAGAEIPKSCRSVSGAARACVMAPTKTESASSTVPSGQLKSRAPAVPVLLVFALLLGFDLQSNLDKTRFVTQETLAVFAAKGQQRTL